MLIRDHARLDTGTAPGSGPFGEQVTAATAAAAAHAETADRDRRLAVAAVHAVTAAGFARHFVPRRWGGREGDFTGMLTAVAELATGCASTAWCASLWATHARYAGYLPLPARAELWTPGPDVCIAAGLGPQGARCRPVSSGWVVDGRWDYVSGAEWSDWMLVSATETDGPGKARVFAVPRSQVRIEDTWDSLGLRATGSDTVVIEETFVPRHRAVPWDTILHGDRSADAARCRQVPAHLPGGALLAAPALGAARHALSSWRRETGGDSSPRTAAVLAASSAEIEAADMMLTRAAHRADHDPVDRLLTAANRRDVSAAVRFLLTAVERLLDAGGVASLATAHPVQRAWRDIRTLAAHAALRPSAAAVEYAAALPHPDA